MGSGRSWNTISLLPRPTPWESIYTSWCLCTTSQTQLATPVTHYSLSLLLVLWNLLTCNLNQSNRSTANSHRKKGVSKVHHFNVCSFGMSWVFGGETTLELQYLTDKCAYFWCMFWGMMCLLLGDGQWRDDCKLEARDGEVEGGML